MQCLCCRRCYCCLHFFSFCNNQLFKSSSTSSPNSMTHPICPHLNPHRPTFLSYLPLSLSPSCPLSGLSIYVWLLQHKMVCGFLWQHSSLAHEPVCVFCFYVMSLTLFPSLFMCNGMCNVSVCGVQVSCFVYCDVSIATFCRAQNLNAGG